jgi:hypothetical protein
VVVFGYITFGCNRDSTNKTTISVVFAKSTKQSLRGVRECTRFECGSLGDHGFELQSCQTKAYKIGMCCFFAKDKALKIKNKGWLARNRGNVSKCKDISTCGLLFQRGQYYKNQDQCIGIMQRGHSISSKINLFPQWYSWNLLTQFIHPPIKLTTGYNRNVEIGAKRNPNTCSSL